MPIISSPPGILSERWRSLQQTIPPHTTPGPWPWRDLGGHIP